MATYPEVIALWPTDGQTESGGYAEIETMMPGTRFVRNVTRPTLTVYLPEPVKRNGTGVIICPGGAYHFLNWDEEGVQVADWLNACGAAAFLLKYRVILTPDSDADFFRVLEERFNAPDSGHQALENVMGPHRPLAVADGQQAIRMVRERCVEWGVATERIGMVGFSAGADLTLNAVLEQHEDTRLNFAAPIYIPPQPPIQVPAGAPPIFVAVTADDDLLPGSLSLLSAWKAAGRSVELHVYDRGGHGFGMKKQGLPVDSWKDRFSDWMTAQGFLKAP